MSEEINSGNKSQVVNEEDKVGPLQLDASKINKRSSQITMNQYKSDNVNFE